jgi:hypothetical protein
LAFQLHKRDRLDGDQHVGAEAPTARAGIAFGKNSAKGIRKLGPTTIVYYVDVITTKQQDVAFPELYFDDWLLESKLINEPRMDFGYS